MGLKLGRELSLGRLHIAGIDCRKCGKLVCGKCAPKDNTKPIPKQGIMEPVRHCKVSAFPFVVHACLLVRANDREIGVL
jgi:hypothetical protein